jgi:hypothetical protein
MTLLKLLLDLLGHLDLFVLIYEFFKVALFIIFTIEGTILLLNEHIDISEGHAAVVVHFLRQDFVYILN